jgi:MFS family permease
MPTTMMQACATAAIAIGLGMGAEVNLLSYLIARHFPSNAFGTAYGGVYALFLFGAGLGPAVIGLLYDRTGNYAFSLTLAAISLIAAALLAMNLDNERIAPRFKAQPAGAG